MREWPGWFDAALGRLLRPSDDAPWEATGREAGAALGK
jgi:hypothetical protein